MIRSDDQLSFKLHPCSLVTCLQLVNLLLPADSFKLILKLFKLALVKGYGVRDDIFTHHLESRIIGLIVVSFG